MALALAPAVAGLGLLWMVPALAVYVAGGHVVRAWDLRLLLPAKKKGRGPEPSPASLET